MLDQQWTSSDALELFTDSADGSGKGFSIYVGGKWAQGCWPPDWREKGILWDITFLELFPVVVALKLWGHHMDNKKLLFHIDNQAVVTILNNKSSKSPGVVVLVRKLVLVSLKHNMFIKGQHIMGKLNGIVDALSGSQFQRFRELVPSAEKEPTPIPDHLWKI